MHLYPINRAAAKVDKDDTMWNYQKANWAEVIVGIESDPLNKDLIPTGQKNIWKQFIHILQVALT